MSKFPYENMKKAYIGGRFPVSIKDKIQEEANKNGQSMNEYMERLLINLFDNNQPRSNIHCDLLRQKVRQSLRGIQHDIIRQEMIDHQVNEAMNSEFDMEDFLSVKNRVSRLLEMCFDFLIDLEDKPFIR